MVIKVISLTYDKVITIKVVLHTNPTVRRTP